MVLQKSRFFITGAIFTAALLSACTATTQSGARLDSTGTSLQTVADDTPARSRARTRLILASSYFDRGQYDVALDEQKKALQIDPSFPDVYNLGGLIYMSIGEDALAKTNFERALSLAPHDANIMHNLGWLYCKLQQYPQANSMFQRAASVRGYREKPKTIMTQGICQARAGDKVAAEATLKQSYELDPSNPVTAYNLANIIFQRGDFAGARFYIRRLNNSQNANAQSLWLGMKVENKLGNEEAVSQLGSQLARRFADSPEFDKYERRAFND